MDRTKEFILQCEKAVEVQELWNPDNLDIYVNRVRIQPACPSRGYLWTSEEITKMKKEYTWLPRQDQLQGIVEDPGTEEYWGMYLCRIFSKFVDANFQTYHSMEQLWLAFVMKEKYQKTWDGKDWVAQV